MDPLSDVLSLLDARSYAARGFQLPGDVAVELGPHEGVKCYAVASGECWLAVEGENPFSCTAGDCILLPRGRSFRLTVDLALPALDVAELRRTRPSLVDAPAALGTYLVGGYFRIAGFPAELLLAALPPLRFREIVGTTPMDYLTRWRVHRAGERLRNSDDSISVIASSLGYESDSAFRKAFRAVMGCSPRDYARQAS